MLVGDFVVLVEEVVDFLVFDVDVVCRDVGVFVEVVV